MVLYLGKDRMATENAVATEDASKSIYDATEKVIWPVEPATKSFMRIDEASMRQVGSQMDAAMQQMRDQMAKMPEDQRKQMEQMMKGVMGGEVQNTTWTVQETSEKETILGRSCKRYAVLQIPALRILISASFFFFGCGTFLKEIPLFSNQSAFMSSHLCLISVLRKQV